MGESELQNLVRSYTNGMIPLEVYREKRRLLIDALVGALKNELPELPEHQHVNAEPTPASNDANDPLKALSEAKPKAKSGLNVNPILIYGSLSVIVTIAVMVGLLSGDSEPELAQAPGNEHVISGSNDQNSSKAKGLVDNFLTANQWDDLQINQLILDWELLEQEEKHQARQTAWNSEFTATIKAKLDEKNVIAKMGDQKAIDDQLLLSSLLSAIDPTVIVPTPTEDPIQVVGPDPEQMQAKAAVADKTSTAVTSTTPVNRKTPRINHKAANKMLSQLSKAYENGNINRIMGLFTKDAVTNHHASAQEIKADYEQLFQTTSARKIKFSNFRWSTKGSTIQGKGRYLAQLNPKNTNVDQVFTADIAVHLKRNSNSYKIKGLYLVNQKFSTKLNNNEMMVASQSTRTKTLPPSNEELQMLIAKFITYYDDGDVERLMALFSREARTNETSTLADIRKDYLQLFSTTKSRQINIKSLTWKTSGKLAVGSGFFEATLKPQNTNNVRKVTGRIRISATKSDQNVFITRLLHNSQ